MNYRIVTATANHLSFERTVRQESGKKRVRPRQGITNHMLIVRAVWGNRIMSPRPCTRIHRLRVAAKIDDSVPYCVALQGAELRWDGPWDPSLLYCSQVH